MLRRGCFQGDSCTRPRFAAARPHRGRTGSSHSRRGPRTCRTAAAACRCGGREGSACRRPRPLRRRQRRAQLLFDDVGIVATTRCRCGSTRAARGGRPAGRARRARGRGRRSRSCGRRPGSSTSASIVFGTSPPCCSTTAVAMPISDLDLARKKPVDLICGSSSAVVAAASARGVGVAGEQRRRDLVHPLVGALRGQDGRDQQLERVAVVELGVGVRMLRFELRHDAAGRRRILARHVVVQLASVFFFGAGALARAGGRVGTRRL